MTEGAPDRAATLYEQVGGERVFVQLVDAFYDRVATDPVLRPLYEEDLEPARRRLRMRHVTWRIGEQERDAWLRAMHAAVAGLDVPEPARAAIWEHLERAAYSLVNAPH